jgi:hypothetical protein
MGLKVFGGLKMVGGQPVRTIVAASSQKRAAELLGVSVSFLRDYYPVTSKATELKAALALPEVVLQASSDRGDDFQPVSTRR